MKSKTLASIGAVVLYVYCEFFQASPFAFIEGGTETVATPTTSSLAAETDEDEERESLRALFMSVRLMP